MADEVKPLLSFTVTGDYAASDSGDFSGGKPQVALQPTGGWVMFLFQVKKPGPSGDPLQAEAQAVAGVVLELCAADFMPKGGAEDNTTTITARFTQR